jgi:putative DNA primase/helicase
MKKGDPNDIFREQGPEGVARSFADAEEIKTRAQGDRADEEPPDRGAPPIGEAEAPRVVLVNAASIEPEPVSWLWRYWLQRNVFNLIAGKPGGAKTTVALSFCATVTSGGQWPDGEACSKPWRSVYWSGEDGVCDTLLPRFLAAGGGRDNMEFVHEVREGERKRPSDPSRDMEGLARAVEKLGDVRLIVLDPVALAVKGDSHKNVETRQSLQPFADLCARLGACGLGVHHLTKNTTGGDPLDRVSGSLAFGALPRCVLLTTKDLNGGPDARRVLMRVKVSNGPDWGGFDYRLERCPLNDWPAIEAQRVLWGGPIEGSAREILDQFEGKPTVGHRGATAFLREALKDGPRMAAEVIKEGEAAGFHKRALQRALKTLGGWSEKPSFATGWIWELPERAS